MLSEPASGNGAVDPRRKALRHIAGQLVRPVPQDSLCSCAPRLSHRAPPRPGTSEARHDKRSDQVELLPWAINRRRYSAELCSRRYGVKTGQAAVRQGGLKSYERMAGVVARQSALVPCSSAPLRSSAGLLMLRNLRVALKSLGRGECRLRLAFHRFGDHDIATGVAPTVSVAAIRCSMMTARWGRLRASLCAFGGFFPHDYTFRSSQIDEPLRISISRAASWDGFEASVTPRSARTSCIAWG